MYFFYQQSSKITSTKNVEVQGFERLCKFICLNLFVERYKLFLFYGFDFKHLHTQVGPI